MSNKFRTPKVIQVHNKFPVTVGDSFSFDVYLFEEPQYERPMPVGLGELKVVAADDRENPTVTIEKSISDGIILLDPAIGHFRVYFTDVDTNSLGRYGGILYFEVKFTDEDGNPFTVARGSLALQPEQS